MDIYACQEEDVEEEKRRVTERMMVGDSRRELDWSKGMRDEEERKQEKEEKG